MNLQNNITSAPNFGNFRITKNAVKMLKRRNELAELKPLLNGFKRLGKKCDIKIDAGNHFDIIDGVSYRTYDCTVERKSPRIFKAFMGFTNFLFPNINIVQGNSTLIKELFDKCTTKDFKDLFNDAHSMLKSSHLKK